MATRKGKAPSIGQQVTEMRDKDLMSWAAIGDEFGFAPRTARRHYQAENGEHSHHGLLPGKGGRLPTKSHVTTQHKSAKRKGVKKAVAKKATPKSSKKAA